MFVRTLIPVVAAAFALVAAAPPPLAISASPRFGFEPFSTRVKLTIEPSAANRAACFNYDSIEGNYSSSCWTLDAGSRRVTWRTVENLPAGHYTLALIIVRVDGSQQLVTTTVCSLPSGLSDGEPCT